MNARGTSTIEQLVVLANDDFLAGRLVRFDRKKTQAVEDQLSTSRALAEQAELRKTASQAADLTEQQLLNRYKQGQVSYTDVVTAQASALSARRTLSQLASSRQAAAVALIQGLGGGWHIETP